VLVWNGDILIDAPLTALLDVAAERDAQVLAVTPRPAGEGTVGLDEAGSVVRLRGQVFGREVKSGDYLGMMALGPSVLARLPERGDLFGDVSLPDLAAGRKVWTRPTDASWSDLGDLAAYVAANFAWLSRAGLSSWRAPDARVPAAVTHERSLLGAGVQVEGAGALREVIAWPGARLRAPLSRAVVLSSGRVVPFDAEN
jgi:mannose-1-phosphate guanylyltransferase